MTFTIELTPDEEARLAFARELGFNPELFFGRLSRDFLYRTKRNNPAK